MGSSWGVASRRRPIDAPGLAIRQPEPKAKAAPPPVEDEDIAVTPKANPGNVSDKLLLEHLKDPRWRLRNLYYIKDKDGHEVRFVPNEVQERFFDQIWYRNVVPKARQRGFTTAIQILMLDYALFTPHFAAAVIAQDFPSVLKIFREKIKFAYDRLPPIIRRMTSITKNTESEVIFSNGSSIYVAVSTRSGTLQMLHVSELGQITKKFPEKAREIQIGSLPSVDKHGIIVIESTIESASGLFPDMCRRALQHQQRGTELSPMQYRLHFASWWDAREYEANPAAVVFSKADRDYFTRMEAAIGRPLNDNKRAWYVLKRDEEMSGDWEKMKSQYPTILEEGFEVSQEGLWLGQQMAQVRLQGRIMRLPHDPSQPVFFFWDIGRSDDNAVWCGQEDGPWMNWLAFYESSGEPYAHLINKIRADHPEWTWGKTFLPHDAVQRQAGAYELRDHFALFEDLRVPHLEKVPRVSDLDGVGIEELRAAMAKYRFDEEGCAEGILHLDGYSKQWNERMGLWSSFVLKNGHQHAADSLRQHAQSRHRVRVGSTKPASGKTRRRNAMTA